MFVIDTPIHVSLQQEGKPKRSNNAICKHCFEKMSDFAFSHDFDNNLDS